MKGPKGFIVILPEQIIEIPLKNNLSWLRLFYALPRELVEKRPEYLELPRNIRRVLDSEDSRALIQSDSFLELVWDCYAWAAWQFFQVPKKGGKYQDIPGDWQNYSGNFPLWRMSNLAVVHFREKFETLRRSWTGVFRICIWPRRTMRSPGLPIKNSAISSEI